MLGLEYSHAIVAVYQRLSKPSVFSDSGHVPESDFFFKFPAIHRCAGWTDSPRQDFLLYFDAVFPVLVFTHEDGHLALRVVVADHFLSAESEDHGRFADSAEALSDDYVLALLAFDWTG